jgi:transposase
MNTQTESTKLAVLREAVDRADTLAIAQAKLIDTQGAYLSQQDSYIKSLERRVRELESQINELRCAV